MARKYSTLQDYIVLRATSAAAIVATTADADKVDARIASTRSGYAMVVVSAIDISSGDEKYVITIEGRSLATDAYTVLGTLTLAANVGANPGSVLGAAALFVVDVDVVMKRMRANCTITGTTPTITHSVILVGGATHTSFRPGGVIITA